VGLGGLEPEARSLLFRAGFGSISVQFPVPSVQGNGLSAGGI
jgi:hypothetical protein